MKKEAIIKILDDLYTISFIICALFVAIIEIISGADFSVWAWPIIALVFFVKNKFKKA